MGWTPQGTKLNSPKEQIGVTRPVHRYVARVCRHVCVVQQGQLRIFGLVDPDQRRSPGFLEPALLQVAGQEEGVTVVAL